MVFFFFANFSIQTLPCEHTFCQECLRKFVNPKLLASCPVCHLEHPLPQGDPAALPANQAVLRLLDRVRAARETGQARKNSRCVPYLRVPIGGSSIAQPTLAGWRLFLT